MSVLLGFLAISQEQKELQEIRKCQNDHILRAFRDFWDFLELEPLNYLEVGPLHISELSHLVYTLQQFCLGSN